jgi:hypothetical protein
MTDAAFEAQLIHFVTLYEQKEKLKEDAKAINAQFKEMNDNVLQFLLTKPPGASMQIKNYGYEHYGNRGSLRGISVHAYKTKRHRGRTRCIHRDTQESTSQKKGSRTGSLFR